MSTMLKRLVGTALALWVSVSLATAASVVCGQRETLASILTERLQEKHESVGLTESGMLMELFVSETGAWTLIMTSPKGAACIVAPGTDWTQIARPKDPEV